MSSGVEVEMRDPGGAAVSDDAALLDGQAAGSASKRWSMGQRVFLALGALTAVILVVVVIDVTSSPAVLDRNDAVAAHSELFRSAITAEGARESLQRLTELPHVAGTAGDERTADYVRDVWVGLGLPNVRKVPFDVLLTYPNRGDSIVELLSPSHSAFNATLAEPVTAADPTSSVEHDTPHHGYSPSGDVTGRIVYVNYGREQDFAALEAAGVSLEGAIALARYGRIFRGNKVDFAARAGAVACIIYSDPADDGFVKGTEFPQGPYRPPGAVQRGSVFLGEGDPLTPFYPANTDALRLTVGEAATPDRAAGANWALPHIPSIPISWQDAAPILRNLGGVSAATLGDDWVGGIPQTTYKVGPGPARVRLKTSNRFEVKTIWNVVSTIRGVEEPDRYVILGNHRDAWVAGAVDPSSGSAALNEVAKGFAKLLDNDWAPRRSVVLCSWDAEEYGLVGSTEWVEQHVRSLGGNAVAYLNVDEGTAGIGRLMVRGSPSLAGVIYRVAKMVTQPPCPTVPQRDANGQPATDGSTLPLCDPENYVEGASVFDHWLAQYKRSALANLPADATASRAEIEALEEPPVPALGSGSDYAAFIGHVGVSSVDMRFAPEDKEAYYSVYHSVYDSMYWMSSFGDPEFTHHKAAAEVWGSLAVHIADEPVLPFEFTRYADMLAEFHDSLAATTAADGGTDAQPIGGVLPGMEAGPVVRATDGEAAPSDDPDRYIEVAEWGKSLDLTRLSGLVNRFRAAADAFGEEIARMQDDVAGFVDDPVARRRLNDRMMQVERAFILPEGLPGREWYKHVVFSPAESDYYGSTSFPAVADALARGEWRAAQRELDVTCHLIQRAIDILGADPVLGSSEL